MNIAFGSSAVVLTIILRRALDKNRIMQSSSRHSLKLMTGVVPALLHFVRPSVAIITYGLIYIIRRFSKGCFSSSRTGRINNHRRRRRSKHFNISTVEKFSRGYRERKKLSVRYLIQDMKEMTSQFVGRVRQRNIVKNIESCSSSKNSSTLTSKHSLLYCDLDKRDFLSQERSRSHSECPENGTIIKISHKQIESDTFSSPVFEKIDEKKYDDQNSQINNGKKDKSSSEQLIDSSMKEMKKNQSTLSENVPETNKSIDSSVVKTTRSGRIYSCL